MTDNFVFDGAKRAELGHWILREDCFERRGMFIGLRHLLAWSSSARLSFLLAVETAKM
jgi:hypothetical protein